jgi:ribonuclease P protein component
MEGMARYSKAARLRRKGEFRGVLDRGQVYPGRQALVRRLATRRGRARLGISTPRAYGKAVRRNHFRRLVREAFRQVRLELGSYDYVVSPRRHLVDPTLEGIRADLLSTLTATPAPPRKMS